MIVQCPSCQKNVEAMAPPVRGPANDGKTQRWTCLWCASSVCVWCYVSHVNETHGEKYALTVRAR